MEKRHFFMAGASFETNNDRLQPKTLNECQWAVSRVASASTSVPELQFFKKWEAEFVRSSDNSKSKRTLFLRKTPPEQLSFNEEFPIDNARLDRTQSFEALGL